MLFVSHATKDDPTVTRIAQRLTAANIPFWIDHEHGLDQGDNWSRQIHDAVNACDIGLFVLSNVSAKSTYCEAEWNRILSLGYRLYIARIEDVPTREVPLRLGVIQYADLVKDFDAGMTALIAAINDGRSLDTDAPAVSQAIRVSNSFPSGTLDLPLIGRETELVSVREALNGPNRTVTVLGLGGVGKTRLAAEIASAGTFRDGTAWHTIAKESTLTNLTASIREFLALDKTCDEDQTWATLSKRQLLIVLDNAEDCSQPGAYAARVNNLDISGGSRVLITSRHAWPELRGAKTFDLHAPSQSVAIEILRAMLNLEPPAYPVDSFEARIVNAAHRHPRLIWYAVHWLGFNAYPPEYVIELLTTLQGDDTEEALTDMIHKTVDQIRKLPEGDSAITALRRLATCRNGFTFNAARTIAGENAPRLLATLKQWGLVSFEKGRYEVEPLAAAALGEDERAFQDHYDHYKELAQQHDKKQDYAGLDLESANMEVAFERMVASGQLANAYWLAKEYQNFLENRGRFDQSLSWMERTAQPLSVSAGDERLRGATYNSLGNVYLSLPTGNRRENLTRAIVAYREALRFYTPESAPLDYAKTQNNLGKAYRDLSMLSVLEDKIANLKRAIAAYREALRFYTPEAAPLDYAMTQNNLGVAYWNLSMVEDKATNLQRAIDAYNEALRFRTPESVPLGYAGTQNNLGNVYRDLFTLKNQTTDLQRAIVAYCEALRFCTPEAAPLDYAMTQNNLAIAYRVLSELEDKPTNLQRAIAAYSEALRFYTPEVTPLAYAMTQNNLAIVYRNLSAMEDKTANLQHAIAAYYEALHFRTAETMPTDYAMTQRNLGIAYKDAGDLRTAVECWREAEKYFRLMGDTVNAYLMSNWIFDIEKRLAKNS